MRFSLFAAKTPRHHTAISLQSSKGRSSGVDVLHIYQLALDFAGISSVVWLAPCDDGSIFLEFGTSLIREKMMTQAFCPHSLLHDFLDM